MNTPALFPAGLKYRHCLAVLFIAVFGVYANSLNNGLVMFDDTPADYKAARPLASSNPLQVIAERFSHSPQAAAEMLLTARHLRDLSLQADRLIFKETPWGGHLINVLLHYLAALAALATFSMIFGGLNWQALAGSLFFALHPLQTESVAYLAGRRDLLYGLFFLLAFRSGALYLKQGGRGRLAKTLFFWGLSLLSKQSAVALPAALLVYLPVLGGGLSFRELLNSNRRAAWFLGLAGGAAALYSAAVIATLFKTSILRTGAAPEAYWYAGSALSQYLTLPAIFAKAVSLMILPLNLCADYSYFSIPPVHSPFSISFLFHSSTVAAAAALLYLSRRDPIILFFSAWILATYVPVLPLFPSLHNSEVFAEHWLYLPVFGYAGLVTLAVSRLRQRSLGAAAAVAAAALLFFAGRTAARNPDWKNPETLWAKTLRQQPYCLRALNNYAIVKLGEGKPEEARTLLGRALSVSPANVSALNNLAHLHLSLGEFAEARRRLTAAFRSPAIGQRLNGVLSNLGTLNYREGRFTEAAKNFRFAGWRVRSGVMDPYAATAYAQAELAAGNPGRAETALYEVLKREPDYPPAVKALGGLLLKTGRPAEAAPLLEKTAAKGTADPELTGDLSIAYAQLRNKRAALRWAAETARLAPYSYRAWVVLSGANRASGKHAQALGFARKAFKLSENPETSVELGLAFRGNKDWKNAIRVFEKAVKLYPDDPEVLFHYAGTLWESGQELRSYGALYNLLSRHPGYGPGRSAMEFVREKLEFSTGLILP